MALCCVVGYLVFGNSSTVSLDPGVAQARGDAVWILREASGLHYNSFRYCYSYQENSSRLVM